MQLLGLNNTFIAGYFYFRSPLLKLYETSANTRTDVNLDPDLYNQTTAEDIGSLFECIIPMCLHLDQENFLKITKRMHLLKRNVMQ